MQLEQSITEAWIGIYFTAIRWSQFFGAFFFVRKHGDHLSNKKFLTPVEAAEFLGGLNSRTITRWAREGYLPSYPIGEGKRRLWRFLPLDLERWMHSRRTGQIATDAGSLLSAADAPTGGFFQ